MNLRVGLFLGNRNGGLVQFLWKTIEYEKKGLTKMSTVDVREIQKKKNTGKS